MIVYLAKQELYTFLIHKNQQLHVVLHYDRTCDIKKSIDARILEKIHVPPAKIALRQHVIKPSAVIMF